MYFKRTPKLLYLLFPAIVWRKEANGKTLYLTFDDGPNPKSTPEILKILKRYKSKATFFCIGENIKKYPELTNQIRKEGHTIGNHGYRHLNGWEIKTKKYIKNLEEGECISGSTLFRPPFGRLTIKQYKTIRTKRKIIMWSHMPGDFEKNIPVKTFEKRLTSVKNGDIIVLHDSEKSVTLLKSVLPTLLQKYQSLGL